MSDEDIENYEAEYKGSDQEAAELLELYTQHKGNMDTVSSLYWLAMHQVVSGCGQARAP